MRSFALDSPFIDLIIAPILPEAQWLFLFKTQRLRVASILPLAPVPDPSQCRRLVGKTLNIHVRLLRERIEIVIRNASIERLVQNRDLVRSTRPKPIDLSEKCAPLKHGHGNGCINRYEEAPALEHFAGARDGVQKHLHFLHGPAVMQLRVEIA